MSDGIRGGRWLVLGGTGQLGAALHAELSRRGREVVVPHREQLDLSMPDAILALVASIDPSAVVNAAAYTDVAAAERPENHALAFALNRDAPAALARACRDRSIPFVHVSTDYVFDGARRAPYREEEPTHPLQVYGVSKRAGEERVFEEHATALVVRTSTLFGTAPRARRNYVDAILEQCRRASVVEVVEPPVASPTFAPDLALGILALVEHGASGLVHATNRGHCSRLELARAVVEAAGRAGSVEVRSREAPVADLARPAYSVLDTTRFESFVGSPLRAWREAVLAHVRERSA